MLVISVKLVIDPADAEMFAARLRQHAKNSTAQEGCIDFAVGQAQDEPGTFRMWEVYTGQAAFDEHLAADFMAEWKEFSGPFVKDRDVQICDKIA
jgi:quinol monooxygenase YgiN